MNKETKFNIALVVEQLLSCEIGDRVNFKELNALVGLDIQSTHRHILRSALKIAFEQHGIQFENERNVGYRRMTDEEVVQSQVRLRKVQRQTEMGRSELSKVKFDGLTPAMQTTHNAKFYTFAAMELLAREASIKKIEARVNPELTLAENLRLGVKAAGEILSL